MSTSSSAPLTSRPPTQVTSTRRPVSLTSFPHRPLITPFVPPEGCRGIYEADHEPGVLVMDPVSSCLPESFDRQATAFFSPGLACPSGYMTAKIDNRMVNTITTLT